MLQKNLQPLPLAFAPLLLVSTLMKTLQKVLATRRHLVTTCFPISSPPRLSSPVSPVHSHLSLLYTVSSQMPEWAHWRVGCKFPKLHLTSKAAQFSWPQLHPLNAVRRSAFSLFLRHRPLEGGNSISYWFWFFAVISSWLMDDQSVQPILLQVTQHAKKNIKNGKVGGPWWHSGLRICCCHSCGAGLIPHLGTSTHHGCGKKKKKIEKRKSKKLNTNRSTSNHTQWLNWTNKFLFVSDEFIILWWAMEKITWYDQQLKISSEGKWLLTLCHTLG